MKTLKTAIRPSVRLSYHLLLSLILALFFLLYSNVAQAKSPKKFDGKKVNFLISWTQLGAAEALARWFKEETGATVRLIKSDYQDLLSATVNDNRSRKPQVDVMMLWYVHLGRLVEDGVIANLDDFYSQHNDSIQPEDFIAKMYEGYTHYKGSQWTLPFDGDRHVLFYRKSVFERHKLTPPETWAEFTETAKIITDKERQNGMYGTAIIAHPTPILIISSFMNRFAGYGGTLLDSTMQPGINSPPAIKALNDMIEQSDYALPTPLETDFAVSRDAFLLGQVAMVEQWTDIGIMAEDINQSMIKGDWDAVPIPGGVGSSQGYFSSLNAGWVLGLSSRAPNREVAEEFLLFCTRPDISLRLNLMPGGGGIDPTRKSVINSADFQAMAPRISALEQKLLQGDVALWPTHPEIPELLETLSECLVAALEGRLSAEESLNSCQAKWIKILSNDD